MLSSVPFHLLIFSIFYNFLVHSEHLLLECVGFPNGDKKKKKKNKTTTKELLGLVPTTS